MKKLAWIRILFVLGWTAMVFAQPQDEAERLRTLVADAKSILYPGWVRDAMGLVDGLPHLYRKPESRALQDELRVAWRFAVDHLDELADDDVEKVLLLCSCWYMDKDDFPEYLLLLADRVENGTLSPQIFRWTSHPFDGPAKGYLERYHNKANVQEVLRRSDIFLRPGWIPGTEEELVNAMNQDIAENAFGAETVSGDILPTGVDSPPSPNFASASSDAFHVRSWHDWMARHRGLVGCLVVLCLLAGAMAGCSCHAKTK
ncbi:MAG: hypothetical protein IKQ55_09885 [Kiritimatiellae bacterium]|nr:hypothetical protein [Kiritimatiellia bacterium]